MYDADKIEKIVKNTRYNTTNETHGKIRQTISIIQQGGKTQQRPQEREACMSNELKQGAVTVMVPDGVLVLTEAGKLTVKEMARQIKSYKTLELCCLQTAQDLQKQNARITVPHLDINQMQDEARQASVFASLVNDLEQLLLLLKQNQILIGARAHKKLLRIRAFIKAYQNTDPHLIEAFPSLMFYLSKKPRRKPETQPTPQTDSPILQ
jgi:hypothetical protein